MIKDKNMSDIVSDFQLMLKFIFLFISLSNLNFYFIPSEEIYKRLHLSKI